jgi:hypothetical protein
MYGIDERKVRAAEDIPLPKVEAVGDSRYRQKKITACKGKGEKVSVRDHQSSSDRRAVPSGSCKFAYTIA